MFGIELKVELPLADVRTFDKEKAEWLREAARGAAATFVTTAASTVPVQTGMARGVFLNVSRALRVSFRTGPRPVRDRMWTGTPYYGETKSPRLGTKFAKYRLPGKRDPTLFTLDVSLAYMVLNATTATHIRSTPWETFTLGGLAMEDYIAQELAYFPEIWDYISVRKLT